MSNPSPIVRLGDPRLSAVCSTVEKFEEAAPILERLSATLSFVQEQYKFTRGSGISAPQIGGTSRVSLIDYQRRRQALINPRIIEHSAETIIIREGCLSFFRFRGNVERYRWVKIEALNQNGQRILIEGEGNLASLIQHELDHLDGILYIDRLKNYKDELITSPAWADIDDPESDFLLR